MTFEEALFQEDAKDINKLNKHTNKAKTAKTEADKASQDLQNKQNIADDMVKACQEIFGLRQGETLKPADILSKLKADPKILDKIMSNQGIMQQIGKEFPKETIEKLKSAPMLSNLESKPENAEGGGETVPAKPATCATAENDANMNDQQKNAWKSIVAKLNKITGADGGAK